MPRPGDCEAAMRPFTRCGAPAAVAMNPPQESSEEIHRPSSNGRDAVQVPPMKVRALAVMAVAAG